MADKKDTIALNGGITEEQINLWKGKYRKVVEISVTDDDATFVGYFHRPDMDTMSAVNKLAKTDEVKSTLVMFDNCWLGGHPVIQDDAIVKMAAIGQLASVFNSCVAEIKNL